MTGFNERRSLHDSILTGQLPTAFNDIRLDFRRQGYEATLERDGLVISNLEDSTSQRLRFIPDGMVMYPHGTYLVELKTVLPSQQSPNYDFEMAPWEKAIELHRQGALIAYVFYPAWRVSWVSDAKPDFIIVPKWRWSEQDYLRIKNRYDYLCPVHHRDVSGGSGTVFGVILVNRILAMKPFKEFWLEVIGKWQPPKQSKLL